MPALLVQKCKNRAKCQIKWNRFINSNEIRMHTAFFQLQIHFCRRSLTYTIRTIILFIQQSQALALALFSLCYSFIFSFIFGSVNIRLCFHPHLHFVSGCACKLSSNVDSQYFEIHRAVQKWTFPAYPN